MGTYEHTAQAIRTQTAVCVVTIVEGMGAVGAKMLVFGEGTREGELGLGPLEEAIALDAREVLLVSRSALRTYSVDVPGQPTPGHVSVFLESLVPPPRLIIVGAGHTSIPLAGFARLSGFHVTLIDARAAFATPERFTDVDEIIVDWPHLVFEQRPITENTYVAVLTHDPKFEEPLLPLLLRSPARYIGVIGSRRTQLQRCERLRLEGFSDHDLARLSGPIGLDLGAVTPEEIALSIMAEIVARQHGRAGGFLSEKLAAAAR